MYRSFILLILFFVSLIASRAMTGSVRYPFPEHTQAFGTRNSKLKPILTVVGGSYDLKRLVFQSVQYSPLICLPKFQPCPDKIAFPLDEIGPFDQLTQHYSVF